MDSNDRGRFKCQNRKIYSRIHLILEKVQN